jgi:hypothetical protein
MFPTHSNIIWFREGPIRGPVTHAHRLTALLD